MDDRPTLSSFPATTIPAARATDRPFAGMRFLKEER